MFLFYFVFVCFKMIVKAECLLKTTRAFASVVVGGFNWVMALIVFGNSVYPKETSNCFKEIIYQ